MGTPRIYGGCFGCQVIAEALGGKVDRNPDLRFVLKAETIRFSDAYCFHSDELLACMPADMAAKCRSAGMKLLVSHGYCVRELPPGVKLLASSPSCTCEVYSAGWQGNLLACQGHPEFDFKYAIEERIWKSVVDTRKDLNDEEIGIAKQSFQDYDGSDAQLVLIWIANFLHA
jgi:GMP synthase-like glutamine amidotransferase